LFVVETPPLHAPLTIGRGQHDHHQDYYRTADLVEKGADSDVLREMIHYVARRLMELGSGAPNAPTAAT
jgi:hypothetical protein